MSLFLILTLLMGLTVSAGVAAAPTGAARAAQTRSNGKPYYIMVNRQTCSVTIYALDDNGYYSIPYKAMICSVGTSSLGYTPTGDFELPGVHWTWKYMSGVYGQYATWVWDDYLLHSIPYETSGKNDSLIVSGYNNLGSPASHGCIRLLTQDAKWIYDNCAKGTKVTIYDSSDPGPLGKPSKAISRLSGTYGWDPTDPNAQNPWKGKIATSVTLSSENLSLSVGTSHQLQATFYPENGAVASGTWVSSNPAVVTVNSSGKLQAVGTGKATITCQFGTLTGHCVVRVVPAGQTVSSSTPKSAYIAAPLSSSVTVNGMAVSLPLYTLDTTSGDTSYYVRLRDLAAVLQNTSAQCDIGVINDVEMVAPGWVYHADGTEGVPRFPGNGYSIPMTKLLIVGNQRINMNVISITDYGGVTHRYYRLHELASLLGFQTWKDDSTGNCVIYTNSAAAVSAQVPIQAPVQVQEQTSPSVASSSVASTQQSAHVATPSSSPVMRNGVAVSLPLYTLHPSSGDSSYYVRLRDLAAVLQNTSAQYDVGVADDVDMIAPGWVYQPDGTEGVARFPGEGYSVQATKTLIVGERKQKMDIISITDYSGIVNYYYRLHELATLLGFQTWRDDSTGTILLSTL